MIALDQGIEWLRHQVKCPDWDEPIRQGIDFVVAEAVLAGVLVLEPGGRLDGEQAEQVGGGQQFGFPLWLVCQRRFVQLASNGVQGADCFRGIQVVLQGVQYRVLSGSW